MTGYQNIDSTVFASARRRAGWFSGFVRPAGILLACIALICTMSAQAAEESGDKTSRVLESIEATAMPGNKIQIKLSTTGTGELPKPLSFTTSNPARIALDLRGTASNVPKRQEIGLGVATSLYAIESKGRTRVVLNLTRLVPYETRIENDDIFLILQSEEALRSQMEPQAKAMPAAAPAREMGVVQSGRRIEKIDFRRGEKGEGRVIVTMSDPSTPVDIREERGKIIVNLVGVRIKDDMLQRLDVMDFATPVSQIDTYRRGDNVQMVVSAEGLYENLSYQTENKLTIEVKPVVKEEQEAARKKEMEYVGDKLTLNFQDIEVRAVLQLIADFTGLNMVTSDTVKGNVTLRLKNVPWDQALDIILKTKGLDMRKMGNVIMVAPAEEIAAREKQEFESQQKIQELAPMFTDLIQVNYASAEEIASLLKKEGNTLLSERGSVTIDERTNTLLVQDTADKLDEIKKLVAKLDRPVQQVLIESRVVVANDDFSKELGSRFGATKISSFDFNPGTSSPFNNPSTAITSGSLNATNDLAGSNTPNLSDTLNSNLPVIGNSGSFALTMLSNNLRLDLELSAMQAEGRGEVISSPRVITSNKTEALIEQGVEVPYQQVSSSGATNVSFKKAVLSLSVTPQITPDDKVIMDLAVNKDSVGDVVLGVPSINTRKVSSQVLVDNGETVVLGGIYEQIKSHDVEKVPFFGDIPGIGYFFRHSSKVDNKAELLIFVTPKILKEGLTDASASVASVR